MALFRRPASPVEGRTSTAKKVAAASVGKYEVGAIETKIAVAEPKVEKPYVKNPTKPIAPDAKAASETKENKMPFCPNCKISKPLGIFGGIGKFSIILRRIDVNPFLKNVYANDLYSFSGCLLEVELLS